jgi:sugar phosphate isomerase/epimerase
LTATLPGTTVHHVPEVTRRGFTAGLIGAGVGLTAPRLPGEESRWGHPLVAGVRVGVQSYTFRKFDLDRMIVAMRSVGLSSVELWQGHLDPATATDDDFKAVRRRLSAAKIEVNAYCVNFDDDASDDLLERSFAGARLLGTHIMTSSVRKPMVPRLAALCRKHEMRLGLHNHWLPPDFAGDRTQEFEGPEDFLEALRSSPYVSLNLDIGHFSAAGHDPVAFFRKHHARIVSLHVKDRDRDPERSYRRFGEGATPIREMAQAIKDVHFHYAANLEYEIEENDPTEGVRHAFDYFKKALLA